MNILNYLPQLGLKPNLVNGMLFSSFASASASEVPFSPEDIPGLQLWLDAEQGLYQTTDTSTPAVADGDPVGRWSDQSGNNRHFTQAVSASRLTLKLATLNGLPVLRFDGTDDWMEAGDLSAAFPSAATLFIVFTVNDASLARELYITTGNDSYYRYDGDGKGYSGQFRAARINQYPDVALVPTTGSHVRTYRSSAAAYEIWTDGVSAGVQAADYAGGIDHELGRSAGHGRHWSGDIAEVLAYDAALSDSQRQQVEQYLTVRWGLL